jgi:hypothetical protein
MKKTKIGMAILVTGLALSVNSSAQGVYFGIGGGYGFAAGKQDFPTGPDMTSNTSANANTPPFSNVTTRTYTARSFSLGKGVNLGVYGGYMFNKNIGAELGIGYLIGSSSVGTGDKESTTVNPGGSVSTTSDVTTNTVKGSMLRLVPSIRVQFGEDKIKPYATVGMIIGVAGKATSESLETQSSTGPGSSATTTSDITTTFTGGVSMGLHTSVGVTYMLSDMLGIFAEASANLQSARPSKSVITSDMQNGTDQTSKLTTNQAETDYSSSYSTSSATNFNPAVASQGTSIHTPFSSIGFNIGVHITLGGK